MTLAPARLAAGAHETMAPMTQPLDRAGAGALRRECGLVLPPSGGWRWLGDGHVLAGLLAALPVWLALGLTMGGRMRGAETGAAWVSLVLVQPIAEEFVFRGVLQGQLLRLGGARRAGPFTWANLATTAGFVGLHLISQPPAWALATAAPSLLLGHLRERFASVLPAVLVHAFFNAGFGLVALAARA